MPPRAASESLEVFRWLVPVGGVRFAPFVRDANDPRRGYHLVLAATDAVIDPGSHVLRFREYEPAREAPEAHRELAALDAGDPEALAAFASRRGFLRQTALNVESETGTAVPAEFVIEWRQALAEIREAFALWAAIEGGSREQLEGLLWIDPAGVAGLARSAAGGRTRFPRITAGGRLNPTAQAAIRGGDLAETGRFLLAAVLDAKVKEHAHLRILWNTRAKRFERSVGFDSLLGYAWDSFARAFTGGAPVRICARPGCGRPFQVSTESRRGHGTYCATACRVAASRARKRAAALASEGRSVPGIARVVGYPPALVREWLAKRGATRKRVKRRTS